MQFSGKLYKTMLHYFQTAFLNPFAFIRSHFFRFVIITIVITGCGLLLLWPSAASVETEMLIPVIGDSVPSALFVPDAQLEPVELRIRGLKSAIDAFRRLRPQYRLDLSNVIVGINSVPMLQSGVILPKGIEIVAIKPSILTIQVEKKITRNLPVKLAYQGKPSYRMVIGRIQLQPERITVQGPEKQLTGFDEILTKPLFIDGLAESFKTEVALDLPDGVDVAAPAEPILADISLEPRIVQKDLSDLTVQAINTRHPVRIEPGTIQMTVQGPVSVLETIRPQQDIRVYLDLKGLDPGVYVRRAVITLPVQTTLVNASPELFTVTMEKK